MPDIDLSQSEADGLISMEKRRTTDASVNFPAPGEKLAIALESPVEAINRPTKDSAAEFIFRWNDTREARSSESQAYAILNDRDHTLSPAVTDALTNYGISAVPWSMRFDAEPGLAA